MFTVLEVKANSITLLFPDEPHVLTCRGCCLLCAVHVEQSNATHRFSRSAVVEGSAETVGSIDA